MLALAKYTLKGPYYAAAVIGLLTILSVFFPAVSGSPILGAIVAPLLMFIAGSLVGLIILTQNLLSGLKVILVSILGITAISMAVFQAPGLGLSIGLIQWLPIIVLAQSLRMTNSLAQTLLTGIIVGAVMIIMQFMIWPDLENDWSAMLIQMLTQLPSEAAYNEVDLTEFMSRMMHWLILGLIASLYSLFVIIVLFSRWLETKITGSGEFQQEFCNLSLGKPAGTSATVLLGLSIWLRQDWLSSLSILTASAFLFQGIAVIQTKLQSHRFRSALSGLFYALLLIIPQAMILTVIVGIIDNWLFFRKTVNQN